MRLPLPALALLLAGCAAGLPAEGPAPGAGGRPSLSGCQATPATAYVGQPVTLGALVTGPGPHTLSAHFGDGHVAEGLPATRSFSRPGTYEASVHAQSAFGADTCRVPVEVRPLALADTSALEGGGRVVTGAVRADSWGGCDEVVGEAQDSEEPARLAYAYAVVERDGERVPLDVSCIGAPEVEFADGGGLRPFQIADDAPGLVYAVLADRFEGDRWWDRLGVWQVDTGERVYLGEVPEVAGVPGVAVPVGALVAGTSGWGSSAPGRRGLPPWPPDRDGSALPPAECPTELHDVYFDRFGSSTLVPRAHQALGENVEAIGTCPEACVLVTGASYNDEADGMRVATSRAEAVRAFYVESGIDSGQVLAEAVVLGRWEVDRVGYTPTLHNLRAESRIVGCSSHADRE